MALNHAQAESTRAQAVSDDGLWRLTAQAATRTLVLQDALGVVLQRMDWPALSPQVARLPLSTPVLIRNHPQRQSFVVAFGGATELWEISYNRTAEDIFDGLVHDYRMREGLARSGFLGVRRTRLDQPLDDLWVDPQSPHVLGRTLPAPGALQIVNLDIRRVRGHMPVPDHAQVAQTQRRFTPRGDVVRIPVASTALEPPAVCLWPQTWRHITCPGDRETAPPQPDAPQPDAPEPSASAADLRSAETPPFPP